jgi:hypothetical protein
MEDVLDLYAEPYDPQRPRVCFDESPVQLISETRRPLPVCPGQPECYDYEYKRQGTANLFLFVQSLLGWRQVNVTARRTKQDFAQQMHLLVDIYFPEADRIRLVVDNLNTHTPAALYQAFAPDEARRITRSNSRPPLDRIPLTVRFSLSKLKGNIERAVCGRRPSIL